MLWVLAVMAGVAAGTLLAFSPLLLVAAVLATVVVRAAAADLPEPERGRLIVLLTLALGARVAVIAALNLANASNHSFHTAGLLFGDEAYLYDRALRTRDLLLNVPASKYDYQIVYDTHGLTGYLSVLAWLQWLLGPAPYSARALNAVLFVAGAAILFRLARPVFGGLASLTALFVVLFLPSLFFWSISLLKESAYFLATAMCLGAGVVAVRPGAPRIRIAAAVTALALLYPLSELRPGAVLLTGTALAVGSSLAWAFAGRRRLLAALMAAVAVAAFAMMNAPPNSRLTGAVTQAAKQHLGHVFTEGHAYKTLDARYYVHVATPATMTFTLTPPEAARFVARSTWAFLTIPFPWQVATRSEIAFMPEQLLWYVLVLTAIAGGWFALRRDPPYAAIMACYVVLMAFALAVTNGNVGTLIRLRGLVTPFLVWFSAAGLAMLLQSVLRGDTATQS